MKISLKETSIQILFKIIIMIFAGYFLVSKSVVSLNDELFSYTIYGFTLILFYHTIKVFGIKDFVLPAGIYTVIVIMSLMHITLMSSLFKNILLFITLGIISFYGLKLSTKFSGKTSIAASFLYWFMGGIAFYFIISVFNIYIFGLDILGMNETFITYCLKQFRIGAVLGAGIGLGMILPTNKIINLDMKA